jgi:pentatricopeptide repeat protein
MSSQISSAREPDRKRLAEAVRQACIAAALEAHEQAGISGLCQEGRWEDAVEAIRSLDLDGVLAQVV